MKRTFLLLLFFLASILLIVNGVRRLLTFKTTSERVKGAEERLVQLKRENEDLKRELEYKGSQGFAEKEIRDKLGLAKEGEAVVILPKENDENPKSEVRNPKLEPNYIKWWRLFFGS